MIIILHLRKIGKSYCILNDPELKKSRKVLESKEKIFVDKVKAKNQTKVKP